MNEYELLFTSESRDKQLNIELDNGVSFTNSEIHQESFELNESLCSDTQLRIGSCESSFIKFTIDYSPNATFKGRIAHVEITVDDHDPFEIGTYKITSDNPTADRRKREIIAYDSLYEILHADVTDWYNELLPDDESNVTLKEFRDSFFNHFGVEQESVELIHDSFIVTRTLEKKQLSGSEVVNKICELNGCFGHINRQNVFVYVYLQTPSNPIFPSLVLYPANNIFPKKYGNPIEIGIENKLVNGDEIEFPTFDIFPGDDICPTDYIYEKIYGVYRKAQYEDYITRFITGLQIRNERNELVVSVGTDDNIYYIDNNFLLFGKTAEQLSQVAQNILNKIKDIYYRPSEISATGNPFLQVGTPVVIKTRYANIETIILQRRLVGIQSLVDTYNAEGDEYISENINGNEKQLNQISGEVSQVKADLLVARKIITDELEAQSARIGTIEANYVSTTFLVANYATIASLEAVDGKIDNLTSIAITTQNLYAQNINAGQINAGIISTDRLDIGSIAAATVTASTISAAMNSPEQGSIAAGVGSFNVIYWYTNTSGGGQPTYHLVKSYLDSQGRNILYVD